MEKNMKLIDKVKDLAMLTLILAGLVVVVILIGPVMALVVAASLIACIILSATMAYLWNKYLVTTDSEE